MKKKVAFIYFDDLHHIHHFIGVAAELAKNDNIRVDIITYSNEHKYLNNLIKLLSELSTFFSGNDNSKSLLNFKFHLLSFIK